MFTSTRAKHRAHTTGDVVLVSTMAGQHRVRLTGAIDGVLIGDILVPGTFTSALAPRPLYIRPATIIELIRAA